MVEIAVKAPLFKHKRASDSSALTDSLCDFNFNHNEFKIKDTDDATLIIIIPKIIVLFMTTYKDISSFLTIESRKHYTTGDFGCARYRYPE